MSEISLNDLSAWTAANCEQTYSVDALGMLIKRGYLMQGRKEGRVRYLPAAEAKLILASHKPGTHWIANRPRPGKRKDKTVRLDNGNSFVVATEPGQTRGYPVEQVAELLPRLETTQSLINITWDDVV